MNKLLKKISVVTIAISFNLTIFTKPNEAQQSSNQYECINKNDIPTTVVTTQRGVIELIKWKSTSYSIY